MSKIHVFKFVESGVCGVVLHTPMPSGKNAVGNSWKDIWIAAGRNTTCMTEGTGIGRISSTERASIIAGDTIEIIEQIPNAIIQEGASAVNAFADRLISNTLAKYASEYNYYGWTSG